MWILVFIHIHARIYSILLNTSLLDNNKLVKYKCWIIWNVFICIYLTLFIVLCIYIKLWCCELSWLMFDFHSRMAQFTIRIGNQDNRPGCRKPRDRNEAVIFDYSTNNGISWRTLKVLDPLYLSQKPQTVSVHLPSDAKTTETVFRWWQPVGQSGMWSILGDKSLEYWD